MVFSWLRNQRRMELLSEPFPSGWRTFLHNNVRHYEYLDPRRRTTVEQVVQILVAEKNWVGGAGFNVTDEMKVTVAGQAAILVLGLEEPYYFDGVQSIIIYQGRYRHPISARDLAPLPFSWRSVVSRANRSFLAGCLESGRNSSGGHNLVFHEFAHYLDGLDGEVDGDPPLAGREQEQNWYRVTEAEYRRLVGQARRNEVSLLDHYGASNRAEFFAVATECFFEQPQAMQREHEELYAALRDFFRQDPAPMAARCQVPSRRNPSGSPRIATRGIGWRPFGPKTPIRCSPWRSSISTRGGIGWRQPPRPGRFVWILGTGKPISNGLRPASNRGAIGRLWRIASGRMRREPDDFTTYRVRGAAYLGLGKYEAAKRDLDLVLQEDKSDAEALYLRGRVWTALGQHRRAVSDFDRSLAIRPLVAEVYYHNGLANRELGDLDAAEANLAKAFQLDPLVDRQ